MKIYHFIPAWNGDNIIQNRSACSPVWARWNVICSRFHSLSFSAPTASKRLISRSLLNPFSRGLGRVVRNFLEGSNLPKRRSARDLTNHIETWDNPVTSDFSVSDPNFFAEAWDSSSWLPRASKNAKEPSLNNIFKWNFLHKCFHKVQ